MHVLKKNLAGGGGGGSIYTDKGSNDKYSNMKLIMYKTHKIIPSDNKLK